MNKLQEREWRGSVPSLVVLTFICESSISRVGVIIVLVVVKPDTSSGLLDNIAADIA